MKASTVLWRFLKVSIIWFAMLFLVAAGLMAHYAALSIGALIIAAAAIAALGVLAIGFLIVVFGNT